MFCIRPALRFVARAICNQHFVHSYHYVPFIYKPNNLIIFRNDRLFHNDNKELSKLEGKMKLIFTCKKCKTRNNKLISKLAYNKGVIIIRCDGCKNNHLIADNLGWFSEKQKGINIEKIMASKGETVQKIFNDLDGYYEAVTNNEEYKLHPHNINETKESNNNKYFEKINEIGTSNKN